MRALESCRMMAAPNPTRDWRLAATSRPPQAPQGCRGHSYFGARALSDKKAPARGYKLGPEQLSSFDRSPRSNTFLYLPWITNSGSLTWHRPPPVRDGSQEIACPERRRPQRLGARWGHRPSTHAVRMRFGRGDGESCIRMTDEQSSATFVPSCHRKQMLNGRARRLALRRTVIGGDNSRTTSSLSIGESTMGCPTCLTSATVLKTKTTDARFAVRLL
ncbi:hypothetical protein ACVMIH_001657 [Bradyrhizobium sp. USDA 4503]